MATNYDPHDSRSRYHQRHDSFQRQSNDAHLKSGAGQARSRYTDDRHDSRRQYASNSYLGSDAGRTASLRRSPSRSHRSWPPQPFAEDEVASLRRELGGLGRIRDARAREEVPCRGEVNQEQLMVDLFVKTVNIASSDRAPSTAGIPTPPTSEDERARKPKRQPSRIHTDLKDEVPEISRRTASPYAFTKQTKPKQEAPPSASFLSPTSTFQSSSGASERRNTSSVSNSRPSSPRVNSAQWEARTGGGSKYSSASYAANESAIDDSDHEALYPRSGTGYSSKSNTSGPSPRSSVVDFASPAIEAPEARKIRLDGRRNTDSQSSPPPVLRPNVDALRKATTLTAASTLGAAFDSGTSRATSLRPTTYDNTARSRESSYSASRAASPTNIGTNAAGTPPRSPRMSVEVGSRNPSAAGSRVQSASGSRASSPSPQTPHESPRLPRSELDWGAALAANAVNTAKRTRPPSRLSTSMRQESVPNMPHRSHDDANSSPAVALPYPEDDSPFTLPSVSMPSERDHQFFGVPSSIPPYINKDSNKPPPTPSSSSTTSSVSSALPSRPGMHRGYSASVLSRPGETTHPIAPPRRAETMADGFAMSSQTKRDLAAMLKKGLPSCPRPEPVTGYDDWYTVIGAPNLDFCPECVDSVFERSMFRPSFRRAPPRSLNAKVQCTLGRPWHRVAWLLTLQQQRTDLALLKSLTDIESTVESCPGSTESVRSWYGLRDPDGLFVRDFHVCAADVRKIERLLPALTGVLVRLPQRVSYDKRVCALRSEGNRFSAYLDALIATHEKSQPGGSAAAGAAAAQSTRRSIASSSTGTAAAAAAVDPMPLIELVERKTRLRECTRDNMLLGAAWHTLPGMPSLTVCEDCFDSVVEPEARRGAPLALRFSRTPAPAAPHAEGRLGFSCQLYSRRMRKVFRRAVAADDPKYLARKAKERRDAELRLQARYHDLLHYAKQLPAKAGASASSSSSGSGSGSGSIGSGSPALAADAEQKLNKELESITKEWKEEWE